ncbi:DUF4858 domain-containing protein [uncultured Bacteroides sp.]|uniref:DUF4858 domain-containing protein n=1 Tax=uncultured Bacteroides sp. TaxID=162156 RepID=UPI0026188473|nr:DUF4858 domain-containing protein [uncultured Bacteroides sp.]
MKRPKIVINSLTVLLLTAGTPIAAQNTKEEPEIKLNDDAVRMIQFDFNQQPEDKVQKMLEAPIEKRWMKFKEDLAMQRSMTDTTTIKKPDGWIRPEPYTIWTRFGEDPVYDVIVGGRSMEYEIYWTINPNLPDYEEFGKSIQPSTGTMYRMNTAPVGPSLTIGGLDFLGFIYDNFTRTGRMLRHNRKHANAWKIYKDYRPTAADSAKFPSFLRPIPPVIASADTLPEKQETEEATFGSDQYTRMYMLEQQVPVLRTEFTTHKLLPIYPTTTDTIIRQSNIETQAASVSSGKKKSSKKNKQEKAKDQPEEAESRFSYYIRQRMKEDSIRRQEELRMMKQGKERSNLYDVQKQIQRIKDEQN